MRKFSKWPPAEKEIIWKKFISMLTSRIMLKNTTFHEKILSGIQETEGHTP